MPIKCCINCGKKIHSKYFCSAKCETEYKNKHKDEWNDIQIQDSMDFKEKQKSKENDYRIPRK